MDIIVEYGMEDGFSGKLIAPDLTEAIKMAKAIYEQTFECDYAKVVVDGEEVYECCF